MQLDDARVLQALEYGDLTLSCLLLHRVLQAILLVDLDSVLLLVALIEAKSHRSVGTLANDSSDMILLKLPTSLRAG